MGEHSLLSPSASSRWMNCTKSVMFTKDITVKNSKWADEGTAAHEHAAWGLELLNIVNIVQIGYHLTKMPCTPFDCDEMKRYVNHYIEYVRKYMDRSQDFGIEERFEIDVIQGFGTIDFWCIINDTLEIIDLKYGKGVKVNANGNSQLMLYAYGALSYLGLIHDIRNVSMHIVQPRYGTYGNYSNIMVEAKKILDWAKYTVSVKADMALNDKGMFKEGSWCWFCPGKHTCSEIRLSQAIRDFKEVT